MTSIHQEEKLKHRLEWYFKTPFDRYKETGRRPLKFLLQIIKIIVITVQAILFAVDEFSIVDFDNDNVQTFRSMFIKDYDGQDIKRLYSKESVYQHMLFAWKQYYGFENITAGSYKVMKNKESIQPIRFCKQWNDNLRKLLDLQVDPIVDSVTRKGPVHHCYDLEAPEKDTNITNTTLGQFANQNKLPQRIGMILSMTMRFSFQMNYSVVHQENSADCYKFNVKIYFDNEDLDGIMTVSLNSVVKFHSCCREPATPEMKGRNILKLSQTIFDFVVILMCLFSTTLCICSYREHYKVYKETKTFFKVSRHAELNFSDKCVFLSFWLIMLVISDFCAIAGSVIKVTVDWLNFPSLHTACSHFFGISVMFSWIGILKYLGFMKGYNTLLITLKVAFPSIIRFVCCVGFIYVGFVICGWIVLGPYHEKFSGLLITSECLYSLLNGDDMFRTFSLMDDISPPMIYYFSKLYLYVFISLFIFVVLSLFIGIVCDTFERIKEYGHAPKTRVELFMNGKSDESLVSEIVLANSSRSQDGDS